MASIGIQQLRQRYKKIIENEYSEDSPKAENSVAKKQQANKMKFLTEHSENIPHSKPKENSSNSVLVALKERIAQGLHNLSLKDKEIQGYKQTIVQQKVQISKLEAQLAESKSSMVQNSTKIIEQKVVSASLFKEIQQLKSTIEENRVERELVFKQIQFYKRQIKDLKTEKKELLNKFQMSKKEMTLVEKLKSDNTRLKDNIKRMQVIINQCCQQSIKVDLTDKYYLGKPLKQSHCWYSQNLVGQVESFLRKWQIGHTNKPFVDALVKFVDQYHKSVSKSMSSSKLRTKSMYKDADSVRCSTSLQYYPEMSILHKSKVQNSLKKSILLNKCKKKNHKKYTQSLIEQDKDVKSSKIYEEIIDQYQNALKIALQQNEIKPKKIMLLSKELKESFTNFMDETKTKG